LVLARAHLTISGVVQGVYFRANTRRRAMELGLRGWVRNLADGRVEAVCEGEREMIAQLIDWCRVGPPGAQVDGVHVTWEEHRNEFETFVIRS
jgi:acylphosphatase